MVLMCVVFSMFERKYSALLGLLMMVFGTGVASYSYADDVSEDFQRQLYTHRLERFESSIRLLEKIRDLKLSFGTQGLSELITRQDLLSFPMPYPLKRLIDWQADVDQFLLFLYVHFLNEEVKLRKERDKAHLEVVEVFAYKNYLEKYPELKDYIKTSLKLRVFLKNEVSKHAPMGTLISPFELGQTHYQTSVLFKKAKVRGKLGYEILDPRYHYVHEFESFDGRFRLEIAHEGKDGRGSDPTKRGSNKYRWIEESRFEDGRLDSLSVQTFNRDGKEKKVIYQPIWNKGIIIAHDYRIWNKNEGQMVFLRLDKAENSLYPERKEWIFKGRTFGFGLEQKRIFSINPKKLDKINFSDFYHWTPFESKKLDHKLVREWLNLQENRLVLGDKNRPIRKIIADPKEQTVTIHFGNEDHPQILILFIEKRGGKTLLRDEHYIYQRPYGYRLRFTSEYTPHNRVRKMYALYVDYRTKKTYGRTKIDRYKASGYYADMGTYGPAPESIRERSGWGKLADKLAENVLVEKVFMPVGNFLGEVAEGVGSSWGGILNNAVAVVPQILGYDSMARYQIYASRIEIARGQTFNGDFNTHAIGILNFALNVLSPDEKKAQLGLLRQEFVQKLIKDAKERNEPPKYREHLKKSIPNTQKILRNSKWGLTFAQFAINEYGGQHEGRSDLKNSGTAGYYGEKALGFTIELGQVAALGLGLGRLSGTLREMGSIQKTIAIVGDITILSSIGVGLELSMLEVLDHPTAENIEKLGEEIALFAILIAAGRKGRHKVQKEIQTQALRSNYELFDLNRAELLNMESQAAKDLVQKIWRRLAKENHPDKNINVAAEEALFKEALFKKQSEAYKEIVNDIDAYSNWTPTNKDHKDSLTKSAKKYSEFPIFRKKFLPALKKTSVKNGIRVNETADLNEIWNSFALGELTVLHRVNDLKRLNFFLESSADVAEADVIFDEKNGRAEMGHSKLEMTGLSLQQWLSVVSPHSRKRIKIDVKDGRAIPELIGLLKRYNIASSRVIINADVIQGQNGFPIQVHLDQLFWVRQSFPKIIISIAISTTDKTPRFSESEINQLERIADLMGGPIQFAIRAKFVTAELIRRLSHLSEDRTLYFWNGRRDGITSIQFNQLKRMAPHALFDLIDSEGQPIPGLK